MSIFINFQQQDIFLKKQKANLKSAQNHFFLLKYVIYLKFKLHNSLITLLTTYDVYERLISKQRILSKILLCFRTSVYHYHYFFIQLPLYSPICSPRTCPYITDSQKPRNLH